MAAIPQIRDRIPSIKHLYSLLSLNPAAREASIAKSRLDRSKLERLLALHEELCSKGRKPQSLKAFLQSEDVLAIYGASVPSFKSSNTVSRTTFFAFRNSGGQIPDHLCYSAGRKRTIDELIDDPRVGEIIKAKEAREARSKKKRANVQASLELDNTGLQENNCPSEIRREKSGVSDPDAGIERHARFESVQLFPASWKDPVDVLAVQTHSGASGRWQGSYLGIMMPAQDLFLFADARDKISNSASSNLKLIEDGANPDLGPRRPPP